MRDAGLFWLKSRRLDVWKKGNVRGYNPWMDGLVSHGDGEGHTELVIRKRYPSAFFRMSLATDLLVLGADTVVLCYVSTGGFVRGSTLDAMQHGSRSIVRVVFSFHLFCSYYYLPAPHRRLWDQLVAIGAMKYTMAISST